MAEGEQPTIRPVDPNERHEMIGGLSEIVGNPEIAEQYFNAILNLPTGNGDQTWGQRIEEEEQSLATPLISSEERRTQLMARIALSIATAVNGAIVSSGDNSGAGGGGHDH